MGPSANLDNSKNRKIPYPARNLSRILSCETQNIGPKQTMSSRLLLSPQQTVLDGSYSTDDGNRELPVFFVPDHCIKSYSDTLTLLMVRG